MERLIINRLRARTTMSEPKTDPVEEPKTPEAEDNTTPENPEGEPNNPENPEKPAEEPKEKPKEETPEEKERNRKGYEMRKGKAETGVSREEFEKLNESVSNITEENKDLKFRNAHPEVDDDTFKTIKSLSKGTGEDYEKTLDDPIIKSHLETSNAKNRVDGATAPPSTRNKPGGSLPDYRDMSSEDFQKKQEEVLSRRGD